MIDRRCVLTIILINVSRQQEAVGDGFKQRQWSKWTHIYLYKSKDKKRRHENEEKQFRSYLGN